MPCDGNSYVANYRDGLLTLSDGAGHTLDVALDQGDISISGLSADMTEVSVYKTRGRTVSVRKAEDSEPTITFTAMLQRLGSGIPVIPGQTNNPKKSLVSFLMKRGQYAGNVRTSGICGDVYLLNAKWSLTVPEGTDYIELRDVRFTVDLSEGDPDTISASGTIYNTDITIATAV